MDTSTKTIVSFVAVIAIAGAAYYLLTATPTGPQPEAATEAGTLEGVVSAIEADLAALADDVMSIDAETDATMREIEATTQTPQTYDPTSL
ncbi:hypothetical protein KGO06_00905 [Patescibacteria group bacterium]|nr:hypothetical protein [Patescibacteria group bacterium]